MFDPATKFGVAVPVPPRAIANNPDHDKVRFCAAMLPWMLVSFVTELTVVLGSSAATIDRNVGKVAAPDTGPNNPRFDATGTHDTLMLDPGVTIYCAGIESVIKEPEPACCETTDCIAEDNPAWPAGPTGINLADGILPLPYWVLTVSGCSCIAGGIDPLKYGAIDGG